MRRTIIRLGVFLACMVAGCAEIPLDADGTSEPLGGGIASCSDDELYFDGGCRALEWFEGTFAGSAPTGTEFAGVLGSRARRGNAVAALYVAEDGAMHWYAVESGRSLGTMFAGYPATERGEVRYGADSEAPVAAPEGALVYFWMESTVERVGRRGRWEMTSYSATGSARDVDAPSSAGYELQCSDGATSATGCGWVYWIASGGSCSEADFTASCDEQVEDLLALASGSCAVASAAVVVVATVYTAGAAALLMAATSGGVGYAVCDWLGEVMVNESEVAAGCVQAAVSACEGELTLPDTYELYGSAEAAAETGWTGSSSGSSSGSGDDCDDGAACAGGSGVYECGDTCCIESCNGMIDGESCECVLDLDSCVVEETACPDSI